MCVLVCEFLPWIRDLKCVLYFICGCWCVKVCVDKYMLEDVCVCVCVNHASVNE